MPTSTRCARCGLHRPEAARVVDEHGSAGWCGLCLLNLVSSGESGQVQLTVMVSAAAVTA